MVRFGMQQGNEEIAITFNDNQEAIDDLIFNGYLDEDFKDTYYYRATAEELTYEECDDLDAEMLVAGAIHDWIEAQCDERDEEADHEDPFLEEVNDVSRAEYILCDNLWFNQFLEYRQGGF